tara:strand:+ start:24019 stop:25164 length:1146 start_codon:yes stop_codon:yes gene_type:complete
MKKKLLFDLIATQPSPEAKFHGGAEYATNIFLNALDHGYTNFDCIYNPKLDLNDKIKTLCIKNDINLYPIGSISQVENFINKNKYIKFYSSLPYEYDKFNLNNTFFIMDVLGIRELEMPGDSFELFYRNNVYSKLKLLIRKAFFKKRTKAKLYKKYEGLLSIKNKHILTISQHSKYSLLNFFPYLNENEITVTYPSIGYPTKDYNSEKKEDFFLLVSANRWIKNNYRAIIALDTLFSEGKLANKKVIVVGLPNKLIFKIKNKDRFILKDYVNQEELDFYYKTAYCLIYPTLNEGFGYPPLHAMKYKTPVLASAISAVTEICQDAVLYFNPFSISEIRNRILQIDNDLKLYNNLQRKGELRIDSLLEAQKKMHSELLKTIFE